VRPSRIEIFADGADRDAIVELAANPLIKGFTTNPTLMRKAGIDDYATFVKELTSHITEHPISFEVIRNALVAATDEMVLALKRSAYSTNIQTRSYFSCAFFDARLRAVAQGFTVSEVSVPLYPRHAGASKFGVGRIPVGVLDMLAVWFELRFAKKPLLLFGMLGAGLFVFGLLVGLGAVLWRIFAGEGFRPLLNLVEVCMILGSVFFATGLIGELIAAQRAEMRELRARLEEFAQERDTRQNP